MAASATNASSLDSSRRDKARETARLILDTLGPEASLHLVSHVHDESLVEKARRDPAAFIEYAARDKDDRPFSMAPFHYKIQEFIPRAAGLERQWQGIIQLPRDHGKSNQLVYRCLWEIGTDPTIRIKVVSAGGTLAGKLVTLMENNILYNPLVQKVFPHLRPGPVWSGGAFTVEGSGVGEKEFTVEASSITSIGAGGRADLIVFDDVCDFKNSVREPTTREAIKETFADTWVNLLDPPGRMVYLCTPWHSQDLSAHIMSLPGWDKMKLPAIVEDKDGNPTPIWPPPGKWSLEALEDRRLSIGDAAFARQYMLHSISAEDRFFNNDVLGPAMDTRWRFRSPEYAEFVEGFPKVVGVDLAASMQDSAAYTVLVTLAIGPHGEMYLVDIARGRMRHYETVEKIRENYREYHPQLVMVENNGYQQAMIDALEEDAYLIPVAPFTTTAKAKHSESVGIRGMATMFQRGKWDIPVRGLVDRDKFDPDAPVTSLDTWLMSEVEKDVIASLLREFSDYPSGRFSDQVMACWFATHAASLSGMSDMILASSILV